MRFVFRADASTEIGFGHLSRSVTLACAAARTGADVALVTANATRDVRAFVEKRGVRVVALEVESGSATDAAATREASHGAVALVVDGYTFRADYFEQLARLDA